MTEPPRHGVTRGYVAALIGATVTVCAALVIAGWGIGSLLLDRDPVAAQVPAMAGPFIVCVALAVFAWGMWAQALELLRGRRSPHWGVIVSVSVGAYLLWSLGGTLAGMSVSDTWSSPFAVMLIPIWVLCALAFWGVLARRVYGERSTPQWPWEREETGE